MAYDEKLADRARAVIESLGKYSEQKMFGGLGFMVGGNMAVGVMGDDLLIRVDPDEQEKLLKKPGAHPFQMMKARPPAQGMLMVGPAGTKTAAGVKEWVTRGVQQAQALPPKTKKPAKKAAKKRP
jgi:TfoX/Sxy family transcriptional regulator of competence genes